MSSKNKIYTSIQLDPGDRERLQGIALLLGLAQTTGLQMGEVGSISRLLRAIAKGEVKLSIDKVLTVHKRMSIEERFWSKVDKNGPTMPHMKTPCWIYTGFAHPLPRNYGMFTINRNKKRQSIRAHRFSWSLRHGPIPEGILICHECDNPPCVNDEHLFSGTSLDNGRDMAMKKRAVAPKGEDSPHAKITWDKVNEIRYRHANGVTQSTLAKENGLHKATISSIVNYKTWK